MPFSAHLFSLVQHVFGKPPRTNSSQFMGQARALGPEAWVKQRLRSHLPGPSKNPGAMNLGQAKALEPFAWAKRKWKASWRAKRLGQSSGLQLVTDNLHTRVSLGCVETLRNKLVCRNTIGQVLSELPSEFLVQPSMWPL